MTQKNPHIAIITVNYNSIEVTSQMLHSLYGALSECPYPFTVLVVDNGSAQDEAAELRRRFPQARVIRSEQNLGFAGGNNLAIEQTDAELIMLLNNDVIAADDFISPLVRRFEQDPWAGIVSSKIAAYDRPGILQFAGYTSNRLMTDIRNPAYGEPDSPQYAKAIFTPFAHGAAMMIKRETLDKIGPMSTRYFLYFEELDWSVKAVKAGYHIWMEPASRILHMGSHTVGGLSPLKIYYNTRNRMIFARENLPKQDAIRSLSFQLFFSLPKNCMKYLLKGRPNLCAAAFRGAADFIRGKQGYSPNAAR